MTAEEEIFKKVATEFFYHWWNTEGNNTSYGFDMWWEEKGKQLVKDYRKEASKELVEALEYQKETLIAYQKFLIKNELIGSNAFYNAERFLSEIEPDNEKPYLFYEGEKYYFGDRYELSEDGQEWYNRELHGADLRNPVIFNSYSKSFSHIRKIDHTTKYKKQLQELKEQAEKDGVNLKELI